MEAWKRVKANQGSSGIDGVSIGDIKDAAVEKYLEEIQIELM